MLYNITNFLEKRLSPESLDFTNHIQTGFENIDKQLGGFKKGELIVLGGRPGMGKTTFAIQMALQMAKLGNRILYSSHEGSKWMENKILSQIMKKELSYVANPLFQNQILAQKQEVLQQIKSLPFLVSFNLQRIKDLEKVVEENELDVILIDFVQSMSASINNMQEDFDTVIKRLKDLAVNKNVLIIAISCLSRKVEYRGGDRRPMLEDLRGSDLMEQLADKVLFVYRPYYYGISEGETGRDLQNYFELIIALNKSGKSCSLAFKINDSMSYITTKVLGI